MTSRRLLVFLCALVVLLIPTAGLGAPSGRQPHTGATDPGSAWTRDYARGTRDARIEGTDGVVYDAAPLVVGGNDGDLFYGPDFDMACGLGSRLAASMRKLSKLATIIERSGRKVVFTVAPNKSAVVGGLSIAQLPHGVCDRQGLDEQNKVLDHYVDRRYLPLRTVLRKQQRQMYWKTDLHWTTVGASVYTQALAARLDPKLGHRQHYTYSTEERLGGLNALQQIDVPETLEMASPAVAVKVRTARGTPDWSGYPDVVFDNSWVSAPSRRTWPGSTLVLGDSFTAMALQNLRPIFRKGRAMWLGHVDLEDVVHAIKAADTVVLETVEVFAPTFEIATHSFRNKLRRALR
jgi:acetyltransferase AlgX (SGNH hydrolase-like protein)